MGSPDIPPHVLRFIDECIDSVPEMETLTMMCEQPNRAWNGGEIAARLYIPAEQGRHVLSALLRRKMVEQIPGTETFRVATGDPDHWALLQEVTAAYRANLMRIATHIHQKAPASLRHFVRAFDLKKDR